MANTSLPFGEWLLLTLEHKNWSQADLARAAHISRGTISDVISGRRRVGKDMATAIADALKLPPEKAIFAALGRSKIYQRDGQSVDHALGSMERNRAILLLMLDTGIRASELCDLTIEDLDNRNHRVFVRKGKGMKERLLPFSPRTGQMIWRYLAGRKDTQPGDPLFVGRLNRPITRTKLAEMCAGIGKRAGVAGVHPHRFRHTFAIQYLRNGGNAYTLQMMLGHSSLETVRLYLKLAQVDVDAQHRRASPVDAWRL